MADSRRKGVTAEREFCNLLREHGIIASRNLVQVRDPGQPDILSSLGSF
ncbi:MAG: hypothetical protein GF393_10610, partial [Armatimonadia bacterium]|nr:hypothetical protein [Armatimonadia bacterium]